MVLDAANRILPVIDRSVDDVLVRCIVKLNRMKCVRFQCSSGAIFRPHFQGWEYFSVEIDRFADRVCCEYVLVE